jgi:hypothetical protein
MTRSRVACMVAAALAALLVAACGGAGPSNPPVSSAAPSPTGASASLVGIGGFFALSVADLEGTAAWYETKLGLEVVRRPPTANGVAVVMLQGDGPTVELIRQDDGVSLGDVDPTLDDRTLLHGIVKEGSSSRTSRPPSRCCGHGACRSPSGPLPRPPISRRT